MTKDRVRQLSMEWREKWLRNDPPMDIIETIESAILAALDEHDSEEPSEEMLIAGCAIEEQADNIVTVAELFRAMSAVRRAALKEGM